MQPTFSIIIAVRNAIDTIEVCLQSILQQVGANFEIVVCDSVSTDGTLQVLEKYRDKFGYFVSERDQGIADAWNKGIAQAKGEWLYFLGADDQLAGPDVLKKVYDQIKGLPPSEMIAYGHVEIIDPKMGNTYYGAPWEQLRNRYAYMSNLHHQGVFHHRQLFEQYGVFDLSFRIALDYELLRRRIRTHPPFYLGNILIARCQTGGLSTTYKYRSQVLAEFRRANMQVEGARFNLGWEFQRAKAALLDLGFHLGLGSVMLLANKWKRKLLSPGKV